MKDKYLREEKWGAVVGWGDGVYGQESWQETREVNASGENKAGGKVGEEDPGGEAISL